MATAVSLARQNGLCGSLSIIHAAILGEDALRALQMRQDVDSIVEDGIISTADTILQ
jgi:hypothetical protein